MVFMASIEVEPLPGSQMGSGLLGGLVYCFVPADNKKAAERRLQSALEQDRYRLIRLEFLQDYKNLRWETPEDQNVYDRLAKRAALNNAVVYGPFYTWDTDE
jgi:hypothetical protein